MSVTPFHTFESVDYDKINVNSVSDRNKVVDVVRYVVNNWQTLTVPDHMFVGSGSEIGLHSIDALKIKTLEMDIVKGVIVFCPMENFRVEVYWNKETNIEYKVNICVVPT